MDDDTDVLLNGLAKTSELPSLIIISCDACLGCLLAKVTEALHLFVLFDNYCGLLNLTTVMDGDVNTTLGA